MKYLFFSLLVFWLYLSVDAQDIDYAPVEVLVTDFNNNSRSGEQIWFEGKGFEFLKKTVSDESGKVKTKLPGGKTYLIKIKSVGAPENYTEIPIPALGENEIYGTYQILVKYELPKTITLDNTYYGFGKATIRHESYKELNELAELMKHKKSLQIEIAGHTDNVGDSENNKKLSQARANAVKNYLVNKGIEAARVVAKGYGEDFPVDTNDTEAGRQNNRRTEVKILKQ